MFGFIADFIVGNYDDPNARFIGLTGLDTALEDLKTTFLGRV